MSLVDDTLVDGQMWLILQPLGERLPDGPAELVVANTNALAAIIEELAAVKMLHGDIAYSNIGYLPETKKPFFLDFGCAQMLDQVCKGMPLASRTCLEHGTRWTTIPMQIAKIIVQYGLMSVDSWVQKYLWAGK